MSEKTSARTATAGMRVMFWVWIGDRHRRTDGDDRDTVDGAVIVRGFLRHESQFVGAHARADSPAWARAGGARQWIYSNPLLIVMGTIFLLSWFAQSLGGVVVTNEDNAMHDAPPITWAEYVVSPDFWNRTLRNWQSEFLTVGAMVAFAIYLRQRGSSESKPVGLPHHVSSEEAE
ncbi:DUF6766 family protein [Microbacterium sp. NPDC056569]|uniref:DUF6766 family protein n=1 Tax=Microbacterium sp. NPDC056569 TaxID=3345867 RepID=UPI0036736299